jgi:hypothetical protein
MFANPTLPWLTAEAVYFLDHWLSKEDTAIEWGSGRSTPWLASRVKRLIAIEHDPSWHEVVTERLKAGSVGNVEYHLIELGGDARKVQQYSERVLDDVCDHSVDFVLVDGKCRDRCALIGLRKLVPGGILCIDDAERYLPSTSISPDAIGQDGAPPGRWGEFLACVEGWRRVWFSDGVHDNAVFVKPCPSAQLEFGGRSTFS